MREYRNRICSAVLAAVCVIGTALIPSRAVHAEDVVDPIAVQKQAAYDAVPETNGLENWPQGPHVYANSAIVMEMNSGAILYGKKINDKHYPASITKLLTALVALENADPDDEVYFSEDSVSFLEYGDASIGMRPGEILSMNDALYGMLLASANEVSYAIAESVGKKMGGGFETFIQKMNERCEELGCTGSHWTNANGLHDENHYTTAHDMALIGSAVYQFDKFREVTQTLNYTIPPTNLVNESRTFQQNHKMLWVGAHYSYDYCTGGKTGYTDQAKTLRERGVEVLICGGIGAGAQNALAEAGIKLYGGVSGSADSAVQALIEGNLSYNPDVMCDHHGEDHHGDHENCGGHGEGHDSCGGHCGH